MQTWLLIGFAAAATGELARETNLARELRITAFLIATFAFLLALADHHNVI
jgi:hypothetical protein